MKKHKLPKTKIPPNKRGSWVSPGNLIFTTWSDPNSGALFGGTPEFLAKQRSAANLSRVDPEKWHPIAWWLCATHLKQRAVDIWPQPETNRTLVVERIDKRDSRRIALMLWSYAFESLLKGCVLCSRKWPISADPFDWWKKKIIHSKSKPHRPKRGPHDLLWLAREAKTGRRSATEKELLRVLPAFATWMGRYPVPANQNEQRPEYIEADYMSEHMSEPLSELWSKFERLFFDKMSNFHHKYPGAARYSRIQR